MESKQDSANPSEASSQAVASLEGIQRRDKAAILEGLSGESALTKAAKEGNLDKVRAILDLGVSVNSINPNTHTPLIVAAYSQQAAVVRELLDRKADASIREGYSKSTALHKAAFYGNEEIVRMLTEAKASVHCVNASPSRVTPLHYAAGQGHIECCKALLEAGADKSAQDERGYTPINFAEKNGHAAIVKLLEAAPLPSSQSEGAEDDEDLATPPLQRPKSPYRGPIGRCCLCDFSSDTSLI